MDPKGGAYNGYALGQGPDTSAKTLLAQASLIRGLLAAFEATGEVRYRDEASRLSSTLMERFYDPGLKGFLTTLGETDYRYTPKNLAAALGGLRELALRGGVANAARLYTELFQTVVNGKGHEGPAMFLGAAKGDPAVAPVLAGEIIFTPAAGE